MYSLQVNKTDSCSQANFTINNTVSQYCCESFLGKQENGKDYRKTTPKTKATFTKEREYLVNLFIF